MLVNTTRSATIVFRFIFDTLAKFPNKRHTRFAYVARIGPCQCLAARRRGYGRTSSDIGWFLSGVPAPLPGRSLRTDLARFSASSNDTFGQTKIVIRFSPVANVLCSSAHIKDQIRLSSSPGGAQTRQTEINYAFCRASKRRAASIACARILSGSYPHSFAI